VELAQKNLDAAILDDVDTYQARHALESAVTAKEQADTVIRGILAEQDARTHQRNLDAALILHRTEIDELRELLNQYDFNLEGIDS